MTSAGCGNPTVPIRAERSAYDDPNSARRVTVEHCRRELGADCPLTDSELETLLDSLYALANVCVDAFVERQRNLQPSGVEDVIAPAASAIGELVQAQ